LLIRAVTGKIAIMIEKVLLKDFKNHEQTEIQLARVTAVVGPNGSGKTSLLLALQTLNSLAQKVVLDGNWNFESLQQFTRHGSQRISVSVEGGPPQWKVALSVPLQHAGSIDPVFEFDNERWTPQRPAAGPNEEPINRLAVRAFGRTAYFKAIAQNISSASYTLDIPPTLGVDGSDVASVISYLKNSQEETHKLIEDDLKAIVPAIKHVRVHPVPKIVKEKRTISANGNTIAYDEDRKVVAQELLFDTQSGAGLPARMISEGSLVTLALLALLHTSDANLFLFDDVEQALHPLAQRQLIKMLREFAEKHDKQILLTSNSGYITDGLNAKDIWVMALDKEGISRCKRLSDHQDAERLLQVLTTGELADAVGEDWVINPQGTAGAAND
jgi:predicted ATPase